MFGVNGDADAAMETRIWIGWNKFRKLVPLLINKDISLLMRGRLYKNLLMTRTLSARQMAGWKTKINNSLTMDS